MIEGEVLGVKSADAEAPRVGSSAAHVWKVKPNLEDLALGTLKQFLAAAWGDQGEDDEAWQDIAEKTFEGGELTNAVMVLECIDKETKAGNPFTLHKWLRLAEPADIDRLEGVEQIG